MYFFLDWTSIGTISTQKGIKGFPFVGLKSVADGPRGDGRGVPYMLMTDMDVSMKDLLVRKIRMLEYSMKFKKKLNSYEILNLSDIRTLLSTIS